VELSGDEAVLPAGSRLADENRPGHQCFVIIEGAATVEQDGSRLASLGSVALTQGEPERAEEVMQARRPLADGLAVPITRALFDAEYGRCLARTHRRPAALARLRSAHEVLAGLRARPFADAVAAELAVLGMRGRPDANPGPAGLTEQELQVATLVAGGMSNREAAAELYLSPKTIEYHLAHIFAKLGIKTRYQLAARIGAAALCGPLDDGHTGRQPAARLA
jgi:DNA-binding CsgD family transcriptional regulator